MSLTETDWSGIREEYLSTGVSLRALAKKHGLAKTTLQQRAAREDWSSERGTAAGDPKRRIETVTAKLLARLEKAIDEAEDMDSKDIKAMTGALKELKDIQRGEEPDREERLEVRFLGETEELSR